MRKKIAIILILFLTLSDKILAGDVVQGALKIERFASHQGFFQNTVRSITGDKNDYIWIATPNGLVCYDGYSFEYFYHDYNNSESIAGNKINNLRLDQQGKLWIGTDQGLCIYRTDKEQFIRFDSQIRNEAFIKEDLQEQIWVGEGCNLYVFNPALEIPVMQRDRTVLKFDQELHGETILDILFLSHSSFILATQTAIYSVNIHTNHNYTYEIKKLLFDLGDNEITKILKVNNTIWVGTDNGVYKSILEDKRLTIIQQFFYSNSKAARGSIDVLSMFSDVDKNVWIGTKRNGIFKYDRNSENFVSYKYDSKNDVGLTSNRVNCFYEDQFGVLWIGTAQGGLNKLDKHQKPFHNYYHNPYDTNSLPSNLTTNIIEDRLGRIWISFYDEFICRTTQAIAIDQGNNVTFERMGKQFKSLKNVIVVKLYQDHKGYWWIGTQEGLYFYDDKNEKLKQVELLSGSKLLPSLGNRVIEQISPTQIVIGGKQVFLLDSPWEQILNDQPIKVDSALFNLGPGNTVNDFKKDGFGNFWFATQNGLFRILHDGERYVLKNHLNSDNNEKLKLSHKRIFNIHESENGNLWLGSFGGGLIHIKLDTTGKPEKINAYHKADGLPDEVVYGILEDNHGRLWMSTDMGICCFNPLSEAFEVYDVNDGIVNNNFRQATFLKTKDGLMIMGGLNGLTLFDPDKITDNEILPNVLISNLSINNQRIVAGKKYHDKIVLEHPISDTKHLVLDHQNRNISLDIVVLHYSAPQKNQLAYKLQGVNDRWVEVNAGKTTATYTNLSTGTHRFFYKGANNDGIWSDTVNELTIRVLAPWYLRWWSILFWSAIVLMLIYGVFRYLINLEKLKQQLNFEQLDKQRMHELDQAKLRFFTNITHDFKTPLSLIIGPFEKIMESSNHKNNQKYFSIIQNNISRLQRLIDQLISYRKAETGHLELKYTITTLGNFTYPLMEAFEAHAKYANINFFYKVHHPNRQIILDVDNTERILLNLFSNAVKFSAHNGEVYIEAGFKKIENHEIFYFEVCDNGIGISPTQIDKIFDRFYQVDNNVKGGGTGVGLALCKSLVELMQGKISAESTQNTGTVFKIELPVEVSAKTEVEVDKTNERKIATDWFPTRITGLDEGISDRTLPSLLIIDDEQDIRSFLQQALKDSYNITLAIDGADGLNKLNECQPQLVISDVMMPKKNGIEVCEHIKSNPDTCHIPVILLTALDDDTKMIEGLEHGADDYLTKPFSVKHLQTRAKKLIENKQRIIDYFSNSSVVPKEDLKMDEKDRSFLENIVSSIENSLSDSSFGVEELAKSIGMSTSQLYRRLKQLTGQVPNVYIRNLRLQKAAELLKSKKNITAVEVMYQIGIESPSYFSTSFKKMYGVSPIEFQKRN